jgi:glutathione S-transferase
MSNPKPHLVSFKLCPFVQRSVIVLEEKRVDYDISYIDLKSPPDWFKAISPFGKVPVLQVGDTVLFESAVIMEYLDEVNPPSLHPADPLRKAHNRAWIEFSSSLFFCQYNMVMAIEQSVCQNSEQELKEKLRQVEEQLVGPWFNGEQFNLVDIGFAPLFVRLAELEQWKPQGLLDDVPKVKAWSENLLARPSIQHSVVSDFGDLYRNYIATGAGFGAKRFVTK